MWLIVKHFNTVKCIRRPVVVKLTAYTNFLPRRCSSDDITEDIFIKYSKTVARASQNVETLNKR